MSKRLWVGFVLSAVGLAVGLLLAEPSIRVYAGFQPAVDRTLVRFDPMAVLVAPHGELGYRPRPNAVFRYRTGAVATSNALGYRGPVVAVPKPAATFRVVLLGESTTHGWGVADEQTIDAFMRRQLDPGGRGWRIEVVNLAFDGYDSRQLLERLRTDGLRLEPDLIIVNAGINDVRNARFENLRDPDPRTLIWEDVLQRLREEEARGGPGIWTRVKHYLYVARLPALARQYAMEARAGRAEPPLRPNPQAADIFERNLSRITALAGESRIPVIFSTPPSALRSRYGPHATSEISYWVVDAETTQRFRDELARRMRDVVAEARRQGRDVTYVAHALGPSLFLDDAHLTPEGNRQIAANFAAAIGPYLQRDPIASWALHAAEGRSRY